MDGGCQIPMDVINKITAMSPPTSKKETEAFLGIVGFLGTVLKRPHCIMNYHEIKSNMPYSLMGRLFVGKHQR